ncbi:hypothetical protein Glove_313g48 [Diversispora epigaea]|uniref:Uncharacterized protein n=1 Tax=Diversispora epigaea TaxID=1348612 RepID=A0A397HRI4_9GLOM|nr:hypothetical protein Glove_313g48 [Diversispora epigaea]
MRLFFLNLSHDKQKTNKYFDNFFQYYKMKFSIVAVVLSLLAATSFADANQEKRDAEPYYYYKRDAEPYYYYKRNDMKRDAEPYYYYKREANRQKRDAEPYYYYYYKRWGGWG